MDDAEPSEAFNRISRTRAAVAISPYYFQDFWPFTLTDLAPYQPEPGSKWQIWTLAHIRRLIAKYPNDQELWQRASAYFEQQYEAGAPPSWRQECWNLLEDEWWRLRGSHIA